MPTKLIPESKTEDFPTILQTVLTTNSTVKKKQNLHQFHQQQRTSSNHGRSSLGFWP